MKQRGSVNLATALTVASSLRPFDAAAALSVGQPSSGPEHHTRWPSEGGGNRRNFRHLTNEVAMATEQHGQIIETPTEACQAEPGPSVLALLTASTGLAVLIPGIVWFAVFRV
ncbi:hypothetical protein H8B02_25030 [Bradyrhizobium sp. Pear77]|uniref:hypothetical protein n=1 Tax=Bradyrhizobium altum TaxID=1571202 RepID=UPI001E3FE9D2|nr:hypothetical protein [Bradyrhizobium altum]MCC8956571.1 hypothetical protein [Bradyrhizobium altum]